jgi:hypothetical protein
MAIASEQYRRQHERDILEAERRVLALLAANPAVTTGSMTALDERNRRRLTELRSGALDRIAAVLRPILRCMPKSLRRLARRVFFRTCPDPATAERPAAAVPFGPSFPRPSTTAPVAAIVHLFYPEIAGEIRSYLERIPGRVDVYVSTDTEEKRDRIGAAFAAWRSGTVQVRLAENRGRDVAPKLVTFKDLYPRYGLVLHLHGKISAHDSELRLWRGFILENLIGDGAAAASILAAFERNPALGMVASHHYLPVRNNIGWGENLEIAGALSTRMGMSFDPAEPIDFPSGSMFWARPEALAPLLDLNLQTGDFPPEDGGSDGTLAHAIERLYFAACDKAGLRWLKVCRPELAFRDEAAIVPIENEQALATILQDGPRRGGRR